MMCAAHIKNSMLHSLYFWLVLHKGNVWSDSISSDNKSCSNADAPSHSHRQWTAGKVPQQW